jgi:hypothetical protein
MNIYEISQELEQFLNSLPESGELDDEALARYAELTEIKDNKIKSTLYAYLNVKAKLEGITSEYRRLSELKKSTEKQLTNIEKLIKFGLELENAEFKDFGNVGVSFRSSTRAVIVDESVVAEEFKKIKYTIDLLKAKDVLKAGGKIDGIELHKFKNLTIK